jgi:hypothetical protein
MISDLGLKRAAPLSRRVTPFHRRWDWGRRLATSIISASHASVNDESEARRGRPGSGRPDHANANTLVLQDGRIRIRALVYTVQAEYVHVLQSWKRSGAGSAASTVNRFYRRFDRISNVKSPIMSDR